MIFRRSVIAALPLLFLLMTTPASAQDTLIPKPMPCPSLAEDRKVAELRKEIEGNYRKMDRAWERFDVNAAVQFMPVDYSYIDKTGKNHTLSDHKDSLRKLVRRATDVKINTEVNVFTMKGDTITVETRKVLWVKTRREDGIETYRDAFQQNRDFWIKKNGKWLIKQTRIFDFTIKINGQLIKE